MLGSLPRRAACTSPRGEKTTQVLPWGLQKALEAELCSKQQLQERGSKRWDRGQHSAPSTHSSASGGKKTTP